MCPLCTKPNKEKNKHEHVHISSSSLESSIERRMITVAVIFLRKSISIHNSYLVSLWIAVKSFSELNFQYRREGATCKEEAFKISFVYMLRQTGRKRSAKFSVSGAFPEHSCIANAWIVNIFEASCDACFSTHPEFCLFGEMLVPSSVKRRQIQLTKTSHCWLKWA